MLQCDSQEVFISPQWLPNRLGFKQALTLFCLTRSDAVDGTRHQLAPNNLNFDLISASWHVHHQHDTSHDITGSLGPTSLYTLLCKYS